MKTFTTLLGGAGLAFALAFASPAAAGLEGRSAPTSVVVERGDELVVVATNADSMRKLRDRLILEAGQQEQ